MPLRLRESATAALIAKVHALSSSKCGTSVHGKQYFALILESNQISKYDTLVQCWTR